MAADIYTKAFTDAGKWQDACDLINIGDPKRFSEFFLQTNVAKEHETNISSECVLKGKDRGIGVSSDTECCDIDDCDDSVPFGMMGGACVKVKDPGHDVEYCDGEQSGTGSSFAGHIPHEWDPWNCVVCAASECHREDCRDSELKHDYWSCDQNYWYWHHVQPRFTMANPLKAGRSFMADGPNTAMLSGKRQSTISKANGSTMVIDDSFMTKDSECADFVNHAFPFKWVGATRFDKKVTLEDERANESFDDPRTATYLMAVDTSHESMGVKRIHAQSKLPERGSGGATGLDLFSVEEAQIMPWKRATVNTGIAISIPKGTYGRVAPRSGLACKCSVDIAAGVIDSDYTGEIKVCMANQSGETIQVTPGMKIAQLILERYAHADVVEVDELQSTLRGESGFGSTGNSSVKNAIKMEEASRVSDLERSIQAMRECKQFSWKCLERGEQSDESWDWAIKIYNERKYAPAANKAQFDKFLEECQLCTQAVVPTAASGANESSGEESEHNVLHTHGEHFGSEARQLHRAIHKAVDKILLNDASKLWTILAVYTLFSLSSLVWLYPL